MADEGTADTSGQLMAASETISLLIAMSEAKRQELLALGWSETMAEACAANVLNHLVAAALTP